MTIYGHIEHGRVVTEENLDLPDGTPVQVLVIDTPAKEEFPKTSPSLRDLVGMLPENLNPKEYHESRIRDCS